MKNQLEIATTVLMFQLSVKREEVKLDSMLNEDLGCDSLDCIEIMMQLEDEQDIEIEDDEWEKITTVQDIVNLLTKKQEVKDAAALAAKNKEPKDANPVN